MGKNYYLHKNNQTGEVIYLEYNKIKGYPITPKTKIEDAIEVNKVVLVNPSFSQKVIRKKVEIKLKYLIQLLEKIEEDGADEGAIKQSIIEAEKLRVNILNRYIKYLGNTYGSYTLKKIAIIINQLKIKLYTIDMQKKLLNNYPNDLYYLDEEKKGRGR